LIARKTVAKPAAVSFAEVVSLYWQTGEYINSKVGRAAIA
jgi:hypothetical protein